jgi:hypothetical protein
MKSYTDLTDNELVNLTEDEIKRYIDYECAQKGIALLPKNPEKPQLGKPEPDVTYYIIGDFLLYEQKEALDLLEFLQKLKLASLENRYDKDKKIKPISEYDMPKIQTGCAYSKEKFTEIQDEIKKYNETMEMYNELKDEYDKAYNGRKDVIKEINTLINDARKAISRKDFLREQWTRYNDLAEGNTAIALNFMLKAYPEVEKDEELLDEFKASVVTSNE